MNDYGGRANKENFGFIMLNFKKIREKSLHDDVIDIDYNAYSVIERGGTANICILWVIRIYVEYAINRQARWEALPLETKMKAWTKRTLALLPVPTLVGDGSGPSLNRLLSSDPRVPLGR